MDSCPFIYGEYVLVHFFNTDYASLIFFYRKENGRKETLTRLAAGQNPILYGWNFRYRCAPTYKFRAPDNIEFRLRASLR